MRTKLIVCLVVSVLFAGQTLRAQSIDEQTGRCLNTSDWFGLQRLYTAHATEMQPLLRDMSKAMLDHVFARYDEAVQSIPQLIRSHQQDLGAANTLSMIHLYASDLSNMGNNKEAAAKVESVAVQLKASGNVAASAQMVHLAQIYKAMSEYELFRNESVKKGIVIPFRLDSIGSKDKRSVQVIVPSRLNGKQLAVTFDTGAGVNVISTPMARKLGLRVYDIPVEAEGEGRNVGRFAIADKLQMGDLVVRNVPFYVLDITTHVDSVDQYLKHMNCVVGIPLMEAMKEVQFDFSQHHILIPGQESDSDAHNLCMDTQTRNLLMEIRHGDEPLALVADMGNSGLTTLSNDYFQAHADAVRAQGTPATFRSGGLGGVTVTECYRLQKFPVTIGDVKVVLPEVNVLSKPTSRRSNFGIKDFLLFRKVIFNLHKMFLKVEL